MSSKPTSRFLPFSGDSPATSVPVADIFEFDDEFDFWTPPSDDLWADSEKAEVIKRSSVRAPRRAEPPRRASTSAPVNIPDWSRITAQSKRPAVEEEEYDSEGEEEVTLVDVEEKPSWEPPHEYLARQVARRRQRSGTVSCSVEEGVGGTLKGRELWRVRDAIWEKIGFQD